MIIFSYYHILERITRLERGMVNIHDQMRIGFAHISSELRSLSSSVQSRPQPRQRISNSTRRSIDNQFNENDDYDDYNADNDQEEVIEKINSVYEDFYSEGKNEYEDSELQEERRNNSLREREKKLGFILLICH